MHMPKITCKNLCQSSTASLSMLIPTTNTKGAIKLTGLKGANEVIDNAAAKRK